MADNLEKGLRKSRNSFFGKIKNLLIEGGQDESVYEEIEELLISADTGMETSLKIIEELKRRKVPSGNRTEVLKEIIAEILAGAGSSDIRTHESEKPLIYLFAGVNGTGKTTTIGKLAYKLTKNGRKVIVAAADTFRAAAAEQLTEWAERAGCDIIRQDDGADPAAVVFDACNAAKARGADVLLIDTAGRLHTKGNLIEELKKIDRVIKKHGDRYPDESFIVIDANTGQNGLNQVKVFNEALGLSGIVLTKIDGTSRGGLVISAVDKYRIPVKLLGCGEKIEDLHSFDPVSFANILFEPGKEKDSIEYFSKADKKIEMEEKKARLNKEREEKIRRKFEEKRRKKEKKKDLQNKPTKSTAKPALIFVSVVLAVLIALFGFFKYTDTVIEKAAAQADSAVSKG
ncbi:MAG: signal recognition particle-docking protein FtsY, partial [Fibrobacterota bacterium]